LNAGLILHSISGKHGKKEGGRKQSQKAEGQRCPSRDRALADARSLRKHPKKKEVQKGGGKADRKVAQIWIVTKISWVVAGVQKKRGEGGAV